MCAECHSTGVRKNYDAANDRFATTLCGDQRRLRGVPRPGLASRRLGARAAELVAVRQVRRPEQGAARCALTSGVMSPGRSIPTTGNAARSFTPRRSAQGGRDLRPLPCAPRPDSPRTGFQADGCPTRTWSRRSPAGSITPTGRCWTRSTITARSSRARCSRPASPAAIATSRTARKLRAPGDGVCLQCHASDKYAAVTHHRHEALNPPLACASCHMPARTYMVVDRRHDHSFRVPRPDLSAKLGTPNACNDCHADKPAEWAASAIERWHGPNRKGFQNYAEAFHAAWTGRADAAGAACGRGVGPQCSGVCARERADRAWATRSRRRTSIWRGRGCPTPTRWCGSARSTCLKMCRPISFGRLSRRSSPIPIAACASGRPPCSRLSRPRASRLPTANASSARQPNSSLRSASMPIGRKRARAGQLLRAPRPRRRGRSRIQGRAAAQPAICARGNQPRRSLSPARAGC